MDYPSIRGEELPYHAKDSTWNLLYVYIDAHITILIDECPGYGVQAISILQPQCANMTFSRKIRYDRLF